jgi:hypothetical protein
MAGSPQGSPLAAISVGCEAGRRTCSERETETEELCDQVGLHIVGAKHFKGDEAAGFHIVGEA